MLVNSYKLINIDRLASVLFRLHFFVEGVVVDTVGGTKLLKFCSNLHIIYNKVR